jgi:kinesin family member 2/24
VLTCFAYGQTGSGKTYTMNSVISHAVRDVFANHSVDEDLHTTDSITVVVSYFEVYMSKAGAALVALTLEWCHAAALRADI